MTQIYGTLGPACSEEAVLRAMFEAGMTGVRLNLSHVTLKESEELIFTMRRAAEAAGVRPELLIDMQGPELRAGAIPRPLLLKEGEMALFSPDSRGDLPEDFPGSRIPVPEEAFARILPAIHAGQEILMDDGKLLLRAEEPGDDFFSAEVLRGGVLRSRKSMAFPGLSISLPALTEADRENLRQAVRYGVTAVMQPFVRSPEDLYEVRRALREAGGGGIRLFAKIENRQGLLRAESLIPLADEIVIARGDLGNAMPLWELPAAQKKLAFLCRRAGCPFMVVTQMLASMEQSPVPTRAEVSDIFNAVLDGAASVMVTGETAAGSYPAEAVRYLANTVREAVKYLEEQGGEKDR